jgi:hypothetical protein
MSERRTAAFYLLHIYRLAYSAAVRIRVQTEKRMAIPVKMVRTVGTVGAL